MRPALLLEGDMPCPKRERADRLRCEESLGAFMRQAWPWAREVDRYLVNWHIDCMCDYLTAAIDWQLGNLLIFTLPPGHMKSLGIAVFMPSWLWAQDPQKGYPDNPYALRPGSWRGPGARLVYLGYQHQLIRDYAQKNIDLIQSLWYQQRWGTRFELAGTGVDKFTNDRGGERKSFSMFGGLTGYGAQIIGLDDAHNVQSDSFEADRNKVLNSWNSALPSRLRGAEHGLFVLSMQRTAENDLIGHILAHEFSGIHVCLPYEFERRHPYLFMRDLTAEQQRHCGQLLDKPVIRRTDSSSGADIGPRVGEVWEDRRQEGDVLWPALWPKSAVAERTKTMPSHQKAGQYQQRPTAAEGNMFKRDFFALKQPMPNCFAFIEQKKLRLCRAWDLAWTEAAQGKDPDWTVGLLMGVDPNDIFYILDVVRGRMSPAQIEAAVMRTAAIDGSRCQVRIPQDPGAGKFVAHLLVKKLTGLGFTATVEVERKDKAQRCAPIIAGLENKLIVCCEGRWNHDFIEECCAFTVDDRHEHDDQVDALTAAYRALISRPRWSAVGVGGGDSELKPGEAW
ncbi:MAG: phage terminase large subunit [Stellaceae bacterium]